MTLQGVFVVLSGIIKKAEQSTGELIRDFIYDLEKGHEM